MAGLMAGIMARLIMRTLVHYEKIFSKGRAVLLWILQQLHQDLKINITSPRPGF